MNFTCTVHKDFRDFVTSNVALRGPELEQVPIMKFPALRNSFLIPLLSCGFFQTFSVLLSVDF